MRIQTRSALLRMTGLEALDVVVQAEQIVLRHLSVAAKDAHAVRKWLRGEAGGNSLRRKVASTDEHATEFIAKLKSGEPSRLVLL